MIDVADRPASARYADATQTRHIRHIRTTHIDSSTNTRNKAAAYDDWWADDDDGVLPGVTVADDDTTCNTIINNKQKTRNFRKQRRYRCSMTTIRSVSLD